DNSMDILADGFLVPGTQRADIHDHVNLLRAHQQGGFRFGDLAFRSSRAKRKADHRTDFHSRSGQLGGDNRDPVRVHAHAGEFILAGFPAQLQNFSARGVRTKQCVVDEPGDLRIDFRQLVAGRDAVRAGGDDLPGFRGAGLWAALGATWTHRVRDIQTFGLGESGTADAREDRLTDLGYELIEFRGIHVGSLAYFRSI